MVKREKVGVGYIILYSFYQWNISSQLRQTLSQVRALYFVNALFSVEEPEISRLQIEPQMEKLVVLISQNECTFQIVVLKIKPLNC